MATEEKKWRNTRNRSLYNKEADDGFIFRLPSEPRSVSTNGSIREEADGEDIDLEGVRKQVEMDRFLTELRRSIVKAGSDMTEEQLEDAFQQLANDLTQDDLYMRFLEEEEEVRADQTVDELQQHKATLVENIEKCERELAEWKTVIEERQALTEQAKQGYSKEKYLDFLKLPPKETKPLKTFLSPEQLSMIAPEGHSGFIRNITEQLDLLDTQLDQELSRLSSLCNHVPNLQLDQSMIKATPMTIFKTVKDTNLDQTIS